MSVQQLPLILPLFDTLAEFTPVPECIPSEVDADDFHQAYAFLYSYRGSEATFNAYRRELERLLHWNQHVSHKTLRTLRRQDIEQFIEFCQSPPKQWIGDKQVRRYVAHSGERLANADWRPFVTKSENFSLSQKALQAIFAILGSFYNYLIQEDYVELNPVAQIRQKSKYIRKQQNDTVIRRLSTLQWHYVIETAEQLAVQEPERHERTLFIMQALYAMYLRISELSSSKRWQPQMGHFHQDGDGNWWFTTVGKGNKQRTIAVSDEMLSALRRYRRFLDLSALPTPGETTPLVSNLRDGGPITSTRQIRHIVQHCFDTTETRLLADGFTDEAESLRAATVHWLRHTGISDDVKHRPREHVRDDAGHGSSAITDRYIDVELRARHASNRHKKIKPDD